MGARLLVKTDRQIAELWQDGSRVRTYPVSTARNGLGCVPGSFCTPYGKLRVAKKFGGGLPTGSVLRDRSPTGERWNSDPDNPLFATREDLVLTRILWLEGLENYNANTLYRFIYLQGTNREGLIGTPDSQGSIRFRNDDIEEIFELLPEGAEVEVT
jgi:L,D-transpeptidase YbiS